LSLRQKYLKIISGLVPAGAVGMSLLLGATVPSAASTQADASPAAPVAERLAAIRDAVSSLAGPDSTINPDAGERRLAWGNWPFWNNGWGNWNNWHNWPNWRNFWGNW
jgi:hypothetical protein